MTANTQKQLLNKVIVYGTAILIVLGVGWLIYSSYVPVPAEARNKPTDRPVQTDWVKGGNEPDIYIVEYSDFQCPACRSYAGVLTQLLDELDGRVGLIYRHFPLKSIHLQAELAAQAAEAAGKQGAFWEMHDVLFENQSEWSENPRARQLFIDYAEELGLNVNQFREDLSSKTIKGLVKGDYLDGVQLGITSTPTFFVDGEQITNPSGYEAFKAAITEALPATESAASEE